MRLREALVEILSDPDHAQCRALGPDAEAECVMAGLYERRVPYTLEDQVYGLRAGSPEAVEDIKRRYPQTIAALLASNGLRDATDFDEADA